MEFARYRRAIQEHRGGDEVLLSLDDLELAKALGAVKTLNGEVVVCVLGLLLFGREDVLAERLPTHEVAFQALTGTTVDVNEFSRWPVLRVLEAVEARAQVRRSEREFLLGMVCVGIPNVLPSAFREALANALTHRDYTRLGAVHVQWRAGEIAISNPGGLPDGVRLGNLLVTPPRPRNPLLADALKRAGIVERTARGVDLIFAEQVRCGHPAPRYETDGQTGVNLTLGCDEPDLDLVRLRIEEERRKGRPPPCSRMCDATARSRGAKRRLCAESPPEPPPGCCGSSPKTARCSAWASGVGRATNWRDGAANARL